MFDHSQWIDIHSPSGRWSESLILKGEDDLIMLDYYVKSIVSNHDLNFWNADLLLNLIDLVPLFSIHTFLFLCAIS